LLRRVEDTFADHERRGFGHLTGNGYVIVVVGRKRMRVNPKMHRSEFDQMVQRSWDYPVCFAALGERQYWRFGDRWFWDNEALSPDEVYALLVTRDQRRDASIKRAQSTVAMARRPKGSRARGAIPEDVKQLVWTRDQGRCRSAGRMSNCSSTTSSR